MGTKKTRCHAGFVGVLGRDGVAWEGHLVRHPASNHATHSAVLCSLPLRRLCGYPQSYPRMLPDVFIHTFPLRASRARGSKACTLWPWCWHQSTGGSIELGLTQAGLRSHRLHQHMREGCLWAVHCHGTHATTRHHLIMLMRARLTDSAESEHFQQRLDRMAVKLGRAAHSAKTGLLMKGKGMPSMAFFYSPSLVLCE